MAEPHAGALTWPGEWSYRSPASEDALVALEAKIGMTLPADLRQFLRHSDGGSAWFNADWGVGSSFYFQVFAVRDIEGVFEVGEPDDDLLAVASDGGSGWDFIDRRTNTVVMNYIDDANSEPIACAPSVVALVD
ncbi:MAG: SMI1/KNR4 family protein, partial [Chloroflexota bacterium]|nr:SMI1/KNR4 family protein [Chloroflexota bacterium]